MIRGYLVAISMLVLGLAGVVVIAAQASHPPSGDAAQKQPAAADGMDGKGHAARVAPRPRPAVMARVAPPRRAPAMTPPAMIPADAGTARATPLPADPKPPRAAPRPATPPPAAVIEFRQGRSKLGRKDRRAIRQLVKKHGYKDVQYLLTAYAGEKKRVKRNRSLARRRCRRVARRIRKSGVSRRWIKCADPVYPKQGGTPSAEHKSQTWRRVVIRVEKK